MLLTKTIVQNFKCIEHSGDVSVDPRITVLVGQNESGKTAFLQALDKARSVVQGRTFSVIEDYPRKNLTAYQKRHEKTPDNVVTLEYTLDGSEISDINTAAGKTFVNDLRFALTYTYTGKFTISHAVDEAPVIQQILQNANIPDGLKNTLLAAKSVREVVTMLGNAAVAAEAKTFLAGLQNRFAPDKTDWPNLVEYEIWAKHISPKLPKFFYFDDYYLLPGKINLPTLTQRTSSPTQLNDEDRTVLSLLQMAGVRLSELNASQGYEEIKARLEGLSNSITDRIFRYWTQNKELHVEFDIRADPQDRPPYNSGPNLYIRIRNQRHRVSVPFSQRSKGFIWFFSFIVWFDAVKLQNPDSPLVLLLDEPGLSLHALAQADFLRYIDDLSSDHQILYTTHSPFMVRSDRLHQARLVEDRREQGTLVTDNLTGSDPKTIFPLQAALGYTLAQNLFIGKRNLLVEGPGDLVYLRFFSNLLEAQDRAALRDDVTIAPAGGLDKVATFIALLGANQLEMAVLHDYSGKPDARIDSLVRERLIQGRLILNYAMFRLPASPNPALLVDTDIEDLIAVPLYLELFSATFSKKLNGAVVRESDLPPGHRIVARITEYLHLKGIILRASGGFNHYAVANYLAANPAVNTDSQTLLVFERMFTKVNSLFTVSPA
jgi:energy-coupling factor transporter ATP-binding protein EcfA2